MLLMSMRKLIYRSTNRIVRIKSCDHWSEGKPLLKWLTHHTNTVLQLQNMTPKSWKYDLSTDQSLSAENIVNWMTYLRRSFNWMAYLLSCQSVISSDWLIGHSAGFRSALKRGRWCKRNILVLVEGITYVADSKNRSFPLGVLPRCYWQNSKR